jgi:hypothetical protein
MNPPNVDKVIYYQVKYTVMSNARDEAYGLTEEVPRFVDRY